MAIQLWGEYRPDVSDLRGNNTRVIENVIPRGDGYGPVSDVTAYTSALASACRGAFRGIASGSGQSYIFAGTQTKLYLMDNADQTWDNVSKTAGAHDYALPDNGIWQFAQYGDFVVAVQGGDAPQVFELGVDTEFADLAGSPPIATHVTVVNEFLLLSGLVSNYGRVQWSARSDITGWTAGTDESDFQDMPDGGDVSAIAGGEHSAILLQDYAMRRMTYQPGNPVIFSFDRISEDVGILARYSVVKAGQRIFFISNSGFQQSIDGSVPTPIGKERVDNTFIDEWDDDNVQLTFGFPDPRGTRVYWAYKTTNGAADLFDKILCYDWALDRWTPISISGEYVTSLPQVGQTLEGLDSLGFTLDTLPVSLDSFPASFGKEISVFDSTHVLGFMRGSALEATLETPEQGEPGRQSFISGCRPLSDADDIYGQVSSRQTPASARTWNTEAAVDAAGLIPARVDTRYYRVRNRIPAATVWTYTAGVDCQVIETGNR
jgi:hypothetical protein